MSEHVLYTDGSCLSNPGPGGWAFRCIYQNKPVFESKGRKPKTTNNIMELTAVIKGLKKLLEVEITSDICVHTDSNYVCKGITSWIQNWKKNNWKTSAGISVKNIELWKELDELVQNFKNLSWHWVKAHNGNFHNEYVDSLARSEARSFISFV